MFTVNPSNRTNFPQPSRLAGVLQLQLSLITHNRLHFNLRLYFSTLLRYLIIFGNMHSAASQTMEHPTEQQTPSEDELDRKKPWRRAVKRKREDAGRLGATKEAKKTRRVKKQQQQQRVQLETEKRQDPATEAPRRRDPAAEAFLEECMKDRVERKKKAKRERAERKRAEKARARLEKKKSIV